MMVIDHKILDVVLGALISYCENSTMFGSPEDILEKHLEDGITISKPVMYAAFEKLHKDGYAQMRYSTSKGVEKKNLPRYYFSFDGALLIQKGGYEELVKADSRIKRRSVILDYALIFGGIAAVIVAVPLIIEFIGTVFCFFSCIH